MNGRMSAVRKAIICTLVAISLIIVVPLESRSGGEPPLGSDGSWEFSHPNIRVSDQPYSYGFSRIASDQYGRIFAVWSGGFYVMFSMSTDGGYTWTNSTQVNEHYTHPVSFGSEKPDIATDGRNVYVCWLDNFDDIRFEIYFKKSPIERINFSHPDTVVSYRTANSESDCSIATDGKNVYITWEDQRHIYFDWSPVDNVSFHDDTRVDTAPDDFFRVDPEIATDEKNIYIAWDDSRNNIGTLYSEIYFDWTSVDVLDFSGPDLLVTTDINETMCYTPAVTSDGKEVYIAWSDDRTHLPADMNIYMDHSPIVNLDFSSEDILVNDVWGPTNESVQAHPSIDASRGEVFLVWYDLRDPTKMEQYVYFDWTNASSINFTRPDTMVSDKLEPGIWIGRQWADIAAYDDGTQTHLYVAWVDTRFESIPQIYFAASPPHPLYPDLFINESEVVLSPSTPTQWADVTINATVRDIGEIGVPNATISFYDGSPSLNKKIGESFITVLAHNKTYTQASWVPDEPGNHEIYIVADPDNKLNESDETNNVAIVNVDVKSLRPPTILQATLTGNNLEDVTITWSLSPDDGAGSESVVGYGVYRSMSYNAERLGYSLIASLPNGTFEFTDDLAGEGDPNNYFYQVCSMDLNDNAVCAKDQAGKFTQPLSIGPNLISIPLIQSNESTEKVLQTVKFDKAWVYDTSSEKWKWFMTFKPYKGELRSINETQGFWVNVTEDCNFTVAGIVPFETAILLSEGWNLISFPSFGEGYSVADLIREVNATIRVEGFSSSSEPYRLRVLQETDVLEAGCGYWIEVSVSTRWFVSN